MSNQRIFYSLVSGFTLGIFLDSFFKIGFSFFLFLLIFSVFLFFFGKFFAKEKTKIFLLTLFIFSFALGVLRYEIKDVKDSENKLNFFVGEKTVLTGVITDEPNLKDKSNQLTIETNSVFSSQSEFKTTGKVLVSTGLFPEYKYGDLIQVTGELEKPQNFFTATNNNFDYISFLAKEDIFYVINFAEVKIISSGHGLWLKKQLFTFKNTFINKLNLLIKEPESSFLGGLLLGAKNSLGSELQDDFRRSGVSHIVALSGYNITIVAEGIMVTLAFLPGFSPIIFGVLGIIFFTIMTGGGATVVRASIMALLVLLARSTNRKYDITRALLLAGIFMLIQNPKILVFDISFQLSFLSTLALIYVSPIVEKKITFVTNKYQFRTLLVSTIATQIFVLPFILYKMGALSLVALPTNLLILPIIPLIMFLGFFTVLLGFISNLLAFPIAFLVSLLLSYVLKIIEIFSHLPFSSININNFSFSLIVLIYLVYFVIIWRAQKSSRHIIKDNLFNETF